MCLISITQKVSLTVGWFLQVIRKRLLLLDNFWRDSGLDKASKT